MHAIISHGFSQVPIFLLSLARELLKGELDTVKIGPQRVAGSAGADVIRATLNRAGPFIFTKPAEAGLVNSRPWLMRRTCSFGRHGIGLPSPPIPRHRAASTRQGQNNPPSHLEWLTKMPGQTVAWESFPIRFYWVY